MISFNALLASLALTINSTSCDNQDYDKTKEDTCIFWEEINEILFSKFMFWKFTDFKSNESGHFQFYILIQERLISCKRSPIAKEIQLLMYSTS